METVLTFPKDQVLMQRVFATKSEKEAGRSIWIFAAIILPGSLVLYLIGTGLYVFYHSFPERMNPLLRTDATLPLFIAAELPAGVTGLVLAGLFAAAMGTLSSILNSVATRHDMDSAAERYLGLTTIHYEDVTGKGAKQISFSQVALDQATAYAAEDADVTMRLHRHLWPQIAAQPKFTIPFRHLLEGIFV